MTTQSLPISKTSKDYYISAAVLVGIVVASVLGVYFTHPAKLKTDATIDIFGISIPNMQGVVMRQPRMSIVIFLSVVILVTGFIFIAREALPFFSRRIAWGSVITMAVALIALGFLNADGRSGSWFRFVVLLLVFLLGASVLTEIMVFYRRFIYDREFKSSMWHRIVFAIVCGALVGAMSGSYFHFGVQDGAILDYGSQTSIQQNLNDIQEPNPLDQQIPGNPAPTVPITGVPDLNPLGDSTAP